MYMYANRNCIQLQMQLDLVILGSTNCAFKQYYWTVALLNVSDNCIPKLRIKCSKTVPHLLRSSASEGFRSWIFVQCISLAGSYATQTTYVG